MVLTKVVTYLRPGLYVETEFPFIFISFRVGLYLLRVKCYLEKCLMQVIQKCSKKRGGFQSKKLLFFSARSQNQLVFCVPTLWCLVIL